MKRTAVLLATATAAALGSTAFALPARATTAAPSTNLVIARVFGGGGNSGAYYGNDFVEIFNRGTTAVSLSGWSLQYAPSSSGTVDATKTTALTATASIPAGGYFLFQGNANGSTSAKNAALPTPDQSSNTYAIGSTGSTVMLVDQPGGVTTVASVNDAAIVDELGNGVSAGTGYEGTSAPAESNTTWLTRAGAGCTDTNSNSSDFALENAGSYTSSSGAVTPPAATPRNSGTTLAPCSTATPPASLPEAPLAVGLPLAGVAVVGGLAAVVRRRRRSA